MFQLLFLAVAALARAEDYDAGPDDSRVDYTKFFGSESAPEPSAQPSGDEGFVRPIDFSALFAAAGDLGVAASGDRAQTPFGFNAAAPQNNGTGFTSDKVQFPSLFDNSGSASEAGFRPQDFLDSPSDSTEQAATSQYDIFSPSFSKIEREYSPRPTEYASAIAAAKASEASPSPQSSKEDPQYHRKPQQYRATPEKYSRVRGRPEDVERFPVAGQDSEHNSPKYAVYKNDPSIELPSYRAATQEPPSRAVPSYRAPAQELPSRASPSYRTPVQEPHSGKSRYPGTPTAGPNGKLGYSKTTNTYRPSVTEYEDREGASADNSKGEKKCKKVEKTINSEDVAGGRFRRQAMTCYVCEDPKTGGNYEECSYGSEPTQEAYFVGRSQSYKAKPTESSYRYRRDAEAEVDATIKRGTRQIPDYERDVDSFITSNFGSGRLTSGGASEAATDIGNENCKKVQKDSMTCTVCKDPKTGGSSEQCSYSSDPKSNNYFVAKQSSYSTGDQKPYSDRFRRSGTEEDPMEHAASETSESALKIPDVQGLDPFLYGQKENYDPEAAASSLSQYETTYYAPYKSYEEYFRHLFPELEAGSKASESRDVPDYQYKSSLPEYFTGNDHKKDLDAVLGEFTQKDRSQCKKVVKDKMTCYQCVDKNGMQQEECMFVAASEPKSKHLAYHELKQFRLAPGGKDSSAAAATATENKLATITTSTPSPTKVRRKAFFKKVTTTATPLLDGKTDAETPKTRGTKVVRRSSKVTTTTTTTLTSPPNDAVAASSDKQETRNEKASASPPPELSEQDKRPDGLYSAETKNVFDPVLKVSLPKYMLTRSEHEDIFDEVMASGR